VPILAADGTTEEEHHQHAHQRAHFDQEFSATSPYRLENWQRTYLRRLEPAFAAASGRPFIDCGAGGSAYTVVEAARRGVPSVACDLSVEGMKRARRYAIGEGVADKCLFVVCSAERLPFADGVFGAAASIAVLEHVTDDQAAIAEISRVTASGGRVLLTVPNSLEDYPAILRPIYKRHDRRIGHLRHYSAEDLIGRCQAAGLRPLSTTYSAHWVKVWQLGIHIAARRLRLDDEALWWWLEKRDQRAAGRRNGMHLTVTFER
jgi:ubiquinone/menaquinone biosynthesis C-methylase UbiE